MKTKYRNKYAVIKRPILCSDQLVDYRKHTCRRNHAAKHPLSTCFDSLRSSGRGDSEHLAHICMEYLTLEEDLLLWYGIKEQMENNENNE